MQQPHNIIHTLTHRPYQHFHLRSIMTNLSTSVSCLLLLNQATHTLANNHDDIKSTRGLRDWFTSIFNSNPVTTEAIIDDERLGELLRNTKFADDHDNVSADAKKVDTVDTNIDANKNADEAKSIFKKFSKNLTGKNLVAAGVVTSFLAAGGTIYHRNEKQKYQRARHQQVLALIANQGVPSTLVTENDD